MTEIKLPWPPTILNPNSRAHWAKVAKAKKVYRADCFTCTVSQLGIDARHLLANTSGELGLLVVFHPPSARKYDRDNLLARLKAGLDGMCDALKIDDARFEPVTVSLAGKPIRRGFVQISISQGEGP
jgi:crossover junction endodeoxyribonuclease RusA